jgi:hypothetical protein
MMAMLRIGLLMLSLPLNLLGQQRHVDR